MRRASISVPSNIAEGHQLSSAAYRHHVTVALGSLAELETQLELAVRVGLLREELVSAARDEVRHVRQMLLRLGTALSCG
jgi:four helix bundle protein